MSQLYQHVALLLVMHRKHWTGGHLQLVYSLISQNCMMLLITTYIFLEKLDHYGIRGKINIWLKSYLTLRSQYVEITSNNNKYPMSRYNSTIKKTLWPESESELYRPSDPPLVSEVSANFYR
jgi:hypothetical protein